MAGDAESQENELIALASIYEDDDILSHGTVEENGFEYRSGCLKVSPNIPNPPINFSFKYSPEDVNSSTEGNSEGIRSTQKILYLPPIVVNFVLPSDYPSKIPPKFTLTCSWLDRAFLTKVGGKLDEIWLKQEGQEILYTWVQFLQEDLLDFLDLSLGIEINQEEYNKIRISEDLDVRVMQDVPRFSDILSIVLEYDEQKKKKVYESTPFQCNICFTEKYGRNCIQFKDCGHVYCNECIKSYFDIQIREGNMKALNCPEPGCESQAYPAQIKSLVSDKDFERYETLLLQTTLATMKDITYCPRKFCQSAVLIEPEETIAICPSCRFSFCPFCESSYHGVEPCKLKQAAVKEMCQKYKNSDAKTKKEMELKYGAKILQTTLQNLESEEWIFNNSKNCPDCNASIEKNDGCNKMSCYKCKAYFCWLCMKRLSKANPYDHYNTVNSKCYNKLFQGVNLDNDGEDFEDWLWF